MRPQTIQRVILSLALALLTAPAAVADPASDAQSREFYKKGENAFAMGNYDQAADAFQRAYELSQRPRLLWNLAAAHKRWFEIDPDVAHLRRARAVYENYAVLIGDTHEEGEARREIKELEAKIADWTRDQDDYAVMERCQRAGIAAGVVQSAEDLFRRDPQLAARDVLEPGDHPQRRRLPAAGGADEDHELAVLDLEVELLDGFVAVVEHLGHTIEDDLCHLLLLIP